MANFILECITQRSMLIFTCTSGTGSSGGIRKTPVAKGSAFPPNIVMIIDSGCIVAVAVLRNHACLVPSSPPLLLPHDCSLPFSPHCRLRFLGHLRPCSSGPQAASTPLVQHSCCTSRRFRSPSQWRTTKCCLDLSLTSGGVEHAEFFQKAIRKF